MSKKFDKAKEQVDTKKEYSILDAVTLAQKVSFEKFDSTLRATFFMNLNPKQADQNLRGSIVLPKGTGKVKKVLAVVGDVDLDKATKAGADFVGGEELLDKIKNENWYEFDIIVTTPAMMPKFAKHGKMLGTKGLMPNPKLGTVTGKVDVAIQNIKKGSIEYKVDPGGAINVIFGKRSFTANDLAANFSEILNNLRSSRPSSIKGDFIKSITISTSMGPGNKVSYDK